MSASMARGPGAAAPPITARNNMDSMADTCCLGRNWVLILHSGYTCNVYPYKDDYKPEVDVPIGSCGTVVTDEEGRDHLIIVHEALFFGEKMGHSLLNQNQIRYHIRHQGGYLNDDFTREDEHLGIQVSADGLFIPFDIKGTAIGFESRTPTHREIEDLPSAVLTSGAPWEPQKVHLRQTRAQERAPRSHRIIGEADSALRSISSVLTPEAFDSVADITDPQVSEIQSTERHSRHTPESVSRKWQIGLETARKVIRVTTQKGVRTALHPLTRRYRVDHIDLYRRKLDVQVYTDNLKSKVVSLDGNLYAQIYTGAGVTAVYPTATRDKAGLSLQSFCDDFGVPAHLRADLAGETSGKSTPFMATVDKYNIDITWSEQGRKNQNYLAESEIGVLRRRWKTMMTSKNVPARLWDYGLRYQAEILTRMPRGNEPRTGYERLTGVTPDISEWLDFSFYDLVWYWSTVGEPSRELGRWLGISHRIGSDLCYFILTKAGKVVSTTTLQHVTKAEYTDNQALIEAFNSTVEHRLRDNNFRIDNITDGDYLQDDVPLPDNDTHGIVPSDTEYGDMIATKEQPEVDDHDDYDAYIGAELILDAGGESLSGRVVSRKRDAEGNKIGQRHANPSFDTRAYLLEMQDGSIQEYTANILALNLHSQIDDEGRQYDVFEEICDHKRDSCALIMAQGTRRRPNGDPMPVKTTKGWKLQVRFKGGRTSWLTLRQLKDSNPLETAEYAIAAGIDKEPAFAWWVKDILRQRRRIINRVKSKYWRTTHKFGIRLPHSAQEAYELDRQNGNDLWARAISKEMSRVQVAYEPRDDLDIAECRAGRQLVGYQEIDCHLIFDIKINDLTRKARFVAGGHTTKTPDVNTYSSVVSRESVRLAFLVAALNDLDVFACDISNAYLNAPCSEKIWFVGGPEMGENQGKVMVITRALYGLKSAGASWRSTLAKSIADMGFRSTVADPDVWRREKHLPDGKAIHELLLVYVDDLLCVSDSPKDVLLEIGKQYDIKEGSLAPPDMYLGAQCYQHSLGDGTTAWGMSPDKFVKNAVKIVQEMLLNEDGGIYRLKTTQLIPLPQSYRPELDASPALDPQMTNRYQQLIGLLRWAVEIGRLDIYTEVSLMSQHLALPRQGHLEAVYSIFAYLQKRPKAAIVMDPMHITLDPEAFSGTPIEAWKDFYGDVVEELPKGMPEPRGNGVHITCFVDSDHAGNVVTRRSHSGILIMVNNAPITWYSRRQNTVETSSFGSEFVALRLAKEMVVALRYKLRMFGVPILGPAAVLCDNQGVVKNCSLPASALSKRHNAINYHSVREAAAAGIIIVGKEDGMTNLADAFTKILGRERRTQLFSKFMYTSMYDPVANG